MIEENFIEVYTKFKLAFYQKIFQSFQDREATLTAVEMFCVEAIYALKEPTIQTFANFVGISSPNAAYKVNSLVKKGYLEREQSTEDKREFRLRVTDKFLKYYGISYDYTKLVVERMQERFSSEEIGVVDKVLKIMSLDLMPEVTPKIDEINNIEE